MSDIEIRGGGVVAVDTESLKRAAGILDDLRNEVDRVASALHGSAVSLGGLPGFTAERLELRAWGLQGDAHDLLDRPQRLGSWLRDTAAIYEVVELRAERAVAVAGGDTDAVARIDARIDLIDERHPGSKLQASWSEFWNGVTWQAEIVRQLGAGAAWLGPWAAGGAMLAGWGMTEAVRAVGIGRVASDSRLVDSGDSVRVRPLALTSPSTAAPATLAAAAARIPQGTADIRVERYSMPDGSRQWAVYVAGTKGLTYGGVEALDWKGNVALYGGADSASYKAVTAALEEAGAEPGDVVHAFGHSQGAMIAAHLAVEGEFDTRTLVEFGSPVDAEVGDDTLSVSVRHTDDPVAALAGGGRSGTVGAPGSFVAERSIDPAVGPEDLGLAAHAMTGYVETAGLLDASSDPRMDAVRDVLAELGTATSVDVVEFDAERVSASSEGGE